MRCLAWVLGALSWAALAAPVSAQDAAPDRIAGWRGDIAVIREQFLAADRSFSDAERAVARAELDDLDAHLDTLTDQQIVAGFARTAAAAHNAHTRAYLLRNRGWWRRYPIRIWPFSDGWRVIAVQPGYEALLGARLSRIGGRPINDVQRAVRPLFAGNDAWARYMATYLLTSPDALMGVGVTDEDVVRFEGRSSRGAVAMDVRPMPFVRRDGPEESWWFLSPEHPATSGWIHVLAGRNLPLALQNPAENYLLRRCAGDVLYVQFYRAQNAEGETVAQFGQRVLAELAVDPPKKLVIDLRFNTGGDLILARPLFDALAHARLAPGAELYAISGINTFSAGITPLAQLRQDTRVTIVGEGPGDELDYWSDGLNQPFPYSVILNHFANAMHTYSRASYDLPADELWLDLNVDSLEPDRRAVWRWRDYRRGRDPALSAIGAGC